MRAVVAVMLGAVLGCLATAGVAAAGAAEATQPEEPKASLSGDFRLRYETTTYPAEIPDRDKGVLRFRLAFGYSINSLLSLGARLATGAREDPRTTDVTIDDFGKDLEANLDQAYLELSHRSLKLVGGRFPNPLLRKTEMIWDGDVNPQGLGGSVKLPAAGKLTVQLTGLLFLIDEQATGSDSNMGAGQVAGILDLSQDWGLTLAASYQDYRITSLRNAGLNNIRGNYLDESGTAYRSDFDLLDLFLDLEYRGLGPRLPLRLTADYVKNLGAAVPEDEGITLELWGGRLKERGDMRGRYAFAHVERDAVLGTFSHDNIPLATSYRLHTIAADWQVLPATFLNLTWYIYRADQPRLGDDYDTGYQSRLRLNATVTF